MASIPRLLSLPFALLFLGCSCVAQRGSDGGSGPDATPVLDAASEVDTCDPYCHWDCFGGTQCIDGRAWVNGTAPRACCHRGDPWPGPGPRCGASSHPCAGGSCVVPDRRYASCLQRIGTPTAPCTGFDDCEHLRLYCPEGTAKSPGAPCDSDAECRPAANGASRLRCDLALVPPTCVEEPRPAAPSDYGASCGLTAESVSWINVETVVSLGSCPLCQVMRTETCLRQACTQSCTFDEDCPSGSVCLCGGWGSPVIGYCAAATDRETDEGRAAGLPPCL
jgi:hypothetical protein